MEDKELNLFQKRSKEIDHLNKNNKFLGITVAIMIVVFLFIVAFLFMGLSQAKECMGNPFTYGAKNLENKDTGSVYCSCSFENQEYAPFYFNNETIKALSVYETFTAYE